MRPLARRRMDLRLLAVARGLEADGLVVGSVGNVSLRDRAQIRITPTATPYKRMARRDLVSVDLQTGVRTRGSRAPSRELALHRAVYARRPDTAAIVHCHSAWATAWSFLARPLEPATEEVAYYGIGVVRTTSADAARSGRIADAAVEALGSGRAVLLYGHGTLATGPSVEDAATVARAVEHQAQVDWLLRLAR